MSNSISIIIPMYNAESTIKKLLLSLVKQCNTDRHEIVIVDNNSSDKSVEIVKSFMAEYKNIALHYFNEYPSSYAARNVGVEFSKGRILAFTDADCTPRSDWIDNIEVAFKDELHSLISGSVEFKSVSQKYSIYEVYDKLSSLDQEKSYHQDYGATANLSMNRSVFERVGGFQNVISGGDRQFCLDAKIEGIELRYHPEICVYHPTRSTPEELISKARRLGKGWGMLIHKKNPHNYQIFFAIIRTALSIIIPLNSLKKITRAYKENHSELPVLSMAILVIKVDTIEKYSRLKALL